MTVKRIIVAQRVKSFRREKRLTQEQFAIELGVSPQAISKWEREECYPDITFLPTLADALGCTVNDLIDLFFIIFSVFFKAFGNFLQYDLALFTLCGNLRQATVFKKVRENLFLVFFFGIHNGIILFDQLKKRLIKNVSVEGIDHIKLRTRAVNNSCRLHFFEVIADGSRGEGELAGDLFYVGIFLKQNIKNFETCLVGKKLQKGEFFFHATTSFPFSCI